jgi:hypothetical protein
MKKFMYLTVTISGAAMLMLGVTVGARGAITGGGIKSWAVGMSLMLGGATVKAFGLNRLFNIFTNEEIDWILRQRLREIPSSCRGCRNFHGASYGGVMLVCAIHPKRVEGNTCADYETSKGARKI